MKTRKPGYAAAAFAALIVCGFGASALAGGAEKPETVMVTYHVRAGCERDLARVLADHWSTAKRLRLVLSEPHLVVQSVESNQPVDLVEVFTWRDAGIPDHAPEPIRAAWERMGKLVEARGGRPGIDIVQVKRVR